MNPLWMLSYLPNMPASHIAIFNDLRGPNNSLTMREAAGLMAIREAVQTIERGHADRMIAGATGTRIHSFKTVHALQQEQLANPELPPAEASRPFDANRTGMVVGEGAGADSARGVRGGASAGATIYGEIVGTGSARVGRPRRCRAACEPALANAARAALGVGEACRRRTSGTSTPTDWGRPPATPTRRPRSATCSAPELRAVPVVAAKSSFGNLGAGGGVVETIASVLALARGPAVSHAQLRDAGSEVSGERGDGR